MAQYRIGTLQRTPGAAVTVSDLKDPYASDPERAPFFNVVSAKPFNAEPPLPMLADTYLTPNAAFFVRNHLPVPNVTAQDYALTVQIHPSAEPLRLRLPDLQSKFPVYSVVASVQCAGNRRGEMTDVKEIKGLRWNAGAMSTAKWTGVLLRDVLAFAGLTESDMDRHGLAHCQFEGLDQDALTGTVYGSSIPLDKAWDTRGDVLLAFQMNDEPLPRDHGAPVRVVAPGIVGARSVKWVGKIVVSPQESQSHWQQKDYKGFNSSVDWNNVDWSSAPAIQEMPITAAICEPMPHTLVPAEEDDITVKGYAYAGGGRAVVRVDVSADGGSTWHTADLHPTETGRTQVSPRGLSPQPTSPSPTTVGPTLHSTSAGTVSNGGQLSQRAWAWTQWHASVPLPDALKAAACRQLRSPTDGNKCSMEIIARAVDSAYNTQPETAAGIWNLRGVNNNAWHRVVIDVEPPRKL